MDNHKKDLVRLFIVLNLVDLVMTLLLLNVFGFIEMNPVFKNLSPIEMTNMKLLGVIIVSFGFALGHKRFPVWSYKFICLITLGAVIWNILMIVAELILFIL